MALERTQFDRIIKNFESLDYNKGTGVLNSKKGELVDEKFIFVGLGGTGVSTVIQLKNEIRRQIKKEEIENKVRFIGIDTDNKYVGKDAKELSADEKIMLISDKNVHEFINPAGPNYNIIKDWVHKDLYNESNGVCEFAQTGAGGVRQVGRVHMTYPSNFTLLENSINGTLAGLLQGQLPSGLNIIVFSGIAGGTGSGIIIDAGILLRDIINRNPNVSNGLKTRYRAYILLPDAQGTNNTSNTAKGNRNAYAALKEIDYFRSIENRGESYSHVYGDNNLVTTISNLFDFCTLIDGHSHVGNLNPEVVRQVVVQSVINTIVKNDYRYMDGQIVKFLLESMESNYEDTKAFVNRSPENLFPRNANYTYNNMGYSQCVVPKDLLCAYIMKKVYDEIAKKYDLAIAFDELPAKEKIQIYEEFLETCELDEKTLLKNTVNYTQRLMDGLKDCLVLQGPYYLINFTKGLAGFIEDLEVNALNMSNKAMFSNSKIKYQNLARMYNNIRVNKLLPMNDKLFAIYTSLLEELGKLLTSNAEILTNSKKFKTQFGTEFTWSLIDMTANEQRVGVVKEYLDELVDTTLVQSRVKKFCTMLWDKREEWERWVDTAQTETTFNGAKIIRDFISNEINTIISATSLDLLVKAYTQNKDAKALNSNGEATPDLQVVADTIYDRFDRDASPLASYDNDVYADINVLRYMAVPDDEEWNQFFICLNNKNIGNNNKYRLFRSSISDRVVCFHVNHGISPYMMAWTKRAEIDYENGLINCVGLHIAQSSTGMDWTRQPNLRPQKMWKPDENHNSRERELICKSDKNMEYAKNNGFTECDANQALHFYSVLLPKYSADITYNSLNLDVTKKYKLNGDNSIAALMKENGLCEEIPVEFHRMPVEVPGTTPNNIKDKKWDRAREIARRKVSLMDKIDEGMNVVKQLESRLEEHNRVAEKLNIRNARLAIFIELLARDYLVYDESLRTWSLNLPGYDEIPSYYDFSSEKIKHECKEYYAFEFVLSLDDDIWEKCEKSIPRMQPGMTQDELALLKADKEKANKSKQELKDKMSFIRNNKDDKKSNYSYPMATALFVSTVSERLKDDGLADTIRKFYDSVIKML